MSRISSKRYLAGSKGQRCTLRIPGVCNYNSETTVPAHIRDNHKSGAAKASDISVANACSSCHAKFDGQAGEPLSEVDWLFYALRGLQETLEQRHEAGLLIVPIDPKPVRTIRKRKPADKRTFIAASQRPIPANPSRMQSRGFRSQPSNTKIID